MAKAPTLEVRLIGDVYALRSALAKFLDLSRRGLAFFTSYRYTEAENAEIEAAFDSAKTALSAPPRNCDVGTSDEQLPRFVAAWEAAHRDVVDRRSMIILSVFSRWAQMPYEEKENGSEQQT